jgi:hypothetical protein
MSLGDVISKFDSDQAVVVQMIKELECKKESLKAKAIFDVTALYRANPETELSNDVLTAFDRQGLCIVAREIIQRRALSLEEMSDEILDAMIIHSYRYNNPLNDSEKPLKPITIIEDLFNSLDTDEKRAKLALKSNFITSASSLSKSTSSFLREHFGITLDGGYHEKEMSIIYLSGFNSEIGMNSFSLSMTKNVYDDIEGVADSIIKLNEFTSLIKHFSVFEHTLCANGCTALCIEDVNGEKVVFLSQSYSDDKHFDGDDLKAKLVNACKFIADNFWYNVINNE